MKKFIVFRGNSYTDARSNYIWARKYDSSGRTQHHWERIIEVDPGDIVFQYKDGCIRAVGTAISKCYDEKRDIMTDTGVKNNCEGRRIDLNAMVLDEPIRVSDLKQTIIKYRKEKYSAFNKNGEANQGYLYELEPEIFDLFMNQLDSKYKEALR
jgi:hypothetical protein